MVLNDTVKGHPGIKAYSYPRDPSQYELLSVIGEGGSGLVYRARCVPLDEEVAIKIVPLDSREFSLDCVRHEAVMMRRSDHKNVLRMQGCFISANELWLVLKYHPRGSVADLIGSLFPTGIPDEHFIRCVLQQALEGLVYCHDMYVVHRDIKGANLLLANNGEVRLCDFGISVPNTEENERNTDNGAVTGVGALANGESPETQPERHFQGSPCWMAPEALSQGYVHLPASDVWSLGITALELSLGKPPFSKHTPMRVCSLVLKSDPPTLKALSSHKAKRFSTEFQDFVKQCLVKDQALRPTARELLKHTIFQNIGTGPGVTVEASTVASGDPSAANLSTAPTANRTASAYIRQYLLEIDKTAPKGKGRHPHSVHRLNVKGLRRPLQQADTAACEQHWSFSEELTDAPVPVAAADPQHAANGAPASDQQHGTSPEPPRARDDWREEFRRTSVKELSQYERHGVVTQSGRLTVYNASIKATRTHVALHEYEVDAHLYGHPILKDDVKAKMFALNHPYVLKCKAAWEDGERFVFWVTESKGGGSLGRYLATKGSFGAGDVCRIAHQVIQAALFFNQVGVVHQQLTSFVVYIVNQTTIQVDVVSSMVVKAAWEACAKREWIIQQGGVNLEALLCQDVVSDLAHPKAHSDVYGVGIVAVHALTGKIPFQGALAHSPSASGEDFEAQAAAAQQQQQQQQQQGGGRRDRGGDRQPQDANGYGNARKLHIPAGVPYTWRDFINTCLSPVASRPSLATLLEHSVFKGMPHLAVSVPTNHVDGSAVFTIAQCPACLRPPVDAKRLECGHCVCLTCLEKSHQFTTQMHNLLRSTSGWAFGQPSRTVSCPQCTKISTIDTGKLDTLPDGVVKVPLCDHCEENPATTSCEQCQVTMCLSCSTALHKRGRFKNHVITELQVERLADKDDDDMVGAAEVVQRLKDRADRLKVASENLVATKEQSLEAAGALKEKVASWSSSARAAIDRHEVTLCQKVDEQLGARERTIDSQLGLIDLLNSQIDLVLSHHSSAGEVMSRRELHRFNSLLATPCASEAQRWDARFFGDAMHLPSSLSRLCTVTVAPTQLTWTAPPGPTTDRAARAVVTLAALIACKHLSIPPTTYVSLRVRPKGITEGSAWRVRQLLVFGPSGVNIAGDGALAYASGSQEEHGAELACMSGGVWSAPAGSGDGAWLGYSIGNQDVTTVVVRNYPHKDHAPEEIDLEGSTDGETFVPICTESVVRSGTACWDCILHMPQA
eukprot:TRINITY_DN969_c1_g1_i1.p1 TRINITY_DN969_c1_g1~~TRINITY_DN969_c1_g1_i1.p1  ORF type:complete len:1242 (+),score=381.75 TRINITY_DN969_c1_g1_i1:164-3889(+)